MYTHAYLPTWHVLACASHSSDLSPLGIFKNYLQIIVLQLVKVGLPSRREKNPFGSCARARPEQKGPPEGAPGWRGGWQVVEVYGILAEAQGGWKEVRDLRVEGGERGQEVSFPLLGLTTRHRLGSLSIWLQMPLL